MLIMQKRQSTFKLDFFIKMNDNYRKNIPEFTNKLHHRSNTYQRKSEIIKGRNTLAIKMLKRALDNGIKVDYLLLDSWYAKPNFIKQSDEHATLEKVKLVFLHTGKDLLVFISTESIIKIY
jgi:hypothetical protein